MNTSSSSPAELQTISPVLPDGYMRWALELQRGFIDAWVLMQKNQYQMLDAWQRSLSAVNRELWDQWTCRFGGGVPLDG